jgi:transcription-repair coupling factor (superfamily II helicase)
VTDELIDRYGELPPAAETLLDVSQLRGLCNRIGVSVVSRGKEGLVMKLDERYVPDGACFLQAIAETDGRLVMTAKRPYRLVLKCEVGKDQELMIEGLKVLRKLNKRIDELLEAKKQQEEGDPSTAVGMTT